MDTEPKDESQLMCPNRPGVPCREAWKLGCGIAGYECMSEADREARRASLAQLATPTGSADR